MTTEQLSGGDMEVNTAAEDRLAGETFIAWLYRTFPTRFDDEHDRIVGMYAYDRGFSEGRAYERTNPDAPQPVPDGEEARHE